VGASVWDTTTFIVLEYILVSCEKNNTMAYFIDT
jgi:hypothetical protein